MLVPDYFEQPRLGEYLARAIEVLKMAARLIAQKLGSAPAATLAVISL
jgi:hypothetical protein